MSKKKKIGILLLVVFVIFTGCLYGIFSMFRITDAQVVGNSYYTEEEIKDLVLGKDRRKNGISLLLFGSEAEKQEIPFIDNLEITMLSRKKIKIRVYEKEVIGYVDYMGTKLYFDKDGTVIESTNEELEGIPCIEGLEFQALKLYEPLQVPDKKVFQLILNITQLMKKYEITPDRIQLKSDGNVVLTFQKVRIYLGTGEYMDERVARISTIMSDLEGLSGVLHMEDYTNESTSISFVKDQETE